MAWTSHGHHIEGTERDEVYRPVQVARCGGPGLCGKCSAEQARALQKIREKATRTVEEQWRQKPLQVTSVLWDGTEENLESVLAWLRGNLAREARFEKGCVVFEYNLKTYYLQHKQWVVIYPDHVEIIPDETFQYHFELDV